MRRGAGYFAASCLTSPFAIAAEPTSDLPLPPAPVREEAPTRVVVAVAADSCASCGAHLAADQRYCVECGQPRGATRLPSVGSAAPHEDAALAALPPAGSPPARSPWGWAAANATVFAAVGALLLAVGVGVLIGRSGRGAGAATGPQRVTVVLSGSGAAVGAAAPGATTPAQTATTPRAAAGAKKAAVKAPATKTATPKVVSVGSKGTGPGFQKGKFTGNFFGGG